MHHDSVYCFIQQTDTIQIQKTYINVRASIVVLLCYNTDSSALTDNSALMLEHHKWCVSFCKAWLAVRLCFKSTAHNTLLFFRRTSYACDLFCEKKCSDK